MGLVLVLAYIGLNLLSPGDLLPSLAPFHPILLLAIVSLLPMVSARLQAPEIGKLRTQVILVVLFFGWACVSWLPHGWLSGNLTTIMELGPNVLAYFLALVFLRSPLRLQVMRTLLVAVAVFVMVNAFRELPFARSTGEATPYVIADVFNQEMRIRGLGMLNDPNYFGQYLLMILPLLFVNRRAAGLGVGYLFAIPVTVLIIVGVYFTGSRGAESGMGVLIGLFLIWRFKSIGAVVSTIVGTLMLLAVNAFRSRTISMSSGMDRLAIWSEGLQFFKQSPLFGIGIRGFSDRSALTAHNSYLLCASELGMLGYFLWMSMIVVTFIQLNRVPKVVGESNPALARWAVALKLSLGVYMFTSFFLSRTYDLPLFLLLGMSGAVIATAGGDEAIPLRGTKWAVWSLGICVALLVSIYVMLRLRVV